MVLNFEVLRKPGQRSAFYDKSGGDELPDSGVSDGIVLPYAAVAERQNAKNGDLSADPPQDQRLDSPSGG
ncbi:MAG TPA: hypothetical protein VIG64_07510 [Actinomycetota bacterium]